MDKPKSNKNNSIDVDVLLGKIDYRTQPDPKAAATSKAAVRSHWQQAVKLNKQRQRSYLWAAAASLMLVSSIIFLNLNQQPVALDSEFLAAVEGISGQAQWQHNDGSWKKLQFNDSIKANTRIRTAHQSYLTLHLADQSEIRIAANSEFMAQANLIELKYGQLYHDTDDALIAAPLTILTDQGSVQHIGTRYLVSSEQGEVKVAVRSGKVKITSAVDDQSDQILENNQMASIKTNTPAEINTISAYDELWDWTFTAQAKFDLNNRSLYDFVNWYARQTGLNIEWQNLESASKRVRLQGNINNMSPEQAIKTVFYSTQYDYVIEAGLLQISQQKQ